MMSRFFWCLAAATALLLAIAIAAPLYEGWAFDKTTQPWTFRFDAYGTWLQGSLTPIAIIAALIGVGAQAKEQHASNRLAALGLFAANAKNMAEHINYKAGSAIMGHRPNNIAVENRGPMFYVQSLVANPEQAADGPLRTELARDLGAIIQIAESQEATFLLDHRLIELRNLLEGRGR